MSPGQPRSSPKSQYQSGRRKNLKTDQFTAGSSFYLHVRRNVLLYDGSDPFSSLPLSLRVSSAYISHPLLFCPFHDSSLSPLLSQLLKFYRKETYHAHKMSSGKVSIFSFLLSLLNVFPGPSFSTSVF